VNHSTMKSFSIRGKQEGVRKFFVIKQNVSNEYAKPENQNVHSDFTIWELFSTIDLYKNIKIEYLYSKQKSQEHNQEAALKALRGHDSCRTMHTVSDLT
jgi:hypothetical protein